MNVLMVCLGNICRSPLAEGILRNKIEKAGINWNVDSAGTSHYQTGCPPHQLSQKIAALHGINIIDQRCRQFVKDDMKRFDRIYVMDKNNYAEVKKISKELWDATKVALLLNEVYPGENREIPDPWYDEETAYHKVYAMINEACDVVLLKYNNT